MIREELLGGPLDGLTVSVQPGQDTWLPSRQIINQIYTAERARYYRKVDGRLYYEFANWDLGGWR